MATKKPADKKGAKKKGVNPFAKKGEKKTIKCPKCGATISV